MNSKLVYPIATKYVVGATKITDDSYNNVLPVLSVDNSSNARADFDICLWTLTSDNYIITLGRYSNTILGNKDWEKMCFICF